MYIIEIADKKKTLDQVLEEHDRGLSIAIVEKVCYGIDNNLLRVNIALIVTDAISITLTCSKRNYKSTLETNMKNLIKYEEYEICAQAKKHLDLLQ